MILLDTNVVSAVMRAKPDETVVSWLDRQPASSLWTTAITTMEIRSGILTMSAGQNQRRLTALFQRVLDEMIEGRIAAFDEAAGLEAARLSALRKQRGRPGELRDTMIAGIAEATRATLATRNTRHFEDMTTPVVNPWNH